MESGEAATEGSAPRTDAPGDHVTYYIPGQSNFSKRSASTGLISRTIGARYIRFRQSELTYGLRDLR